MAEQGEGKAESSQAGAMVERGDGSNGQVLGGGGESKGEGERKKSSVVENSRQAIFSWKELSFKVQLKKEKGQPEGAIKTILDNVTGVVHPGEMLAIMGPSGCGKTSLLTSLAGLNLGGQLSGEVLLNGQPRDQYFPKFASFVPQENALMGVFTVEETLWYSAALTLPEEMTREQRQAIVDDVIESMGLSSARHTKVGNIFQKGLSGGQQRRLIIGTELVCNPAIFLLDEPTSGLDSTSAYSVMGVLGKLAASKHSVLATIHQPSSELWDLFDKVLLLSKGRVMYLGPAAHVVEYFSAIGHECPQHYNPADFMLGLVNSDFTQDVNLDDLAEAYQNSALAKATDDQLADIATATARATNKTSSKSKSKADGSVAAKDDVEDQTEAGLPTIRIGPGGGMASPGEPIYSASWIMQFLTLSHRFFLNNARNPGIFVVRLLMYTFLAFVVGVMYAGNGNKGDDNELSSTYATNATSVLFYCQAFLVFMSVAVLPFYLIDRQTYLHERTNGYYGVSPHVLANFLCALPGLLLISVVSGCLIVFPAGLNGFGVFVLAMWISLIIAEALMAVISAIVPHFIVGIALAAGLFGFFMLCEGFFIVKSDIPSYLIWGYYMAFHSYALKIFFSNEFEDAGKIRNNPLFTDGDAILEYYDMDNVSIWKNCVILVAYAFGFQIIYYLLLKFRDRSRA